MFRTAIGFHDALVAAPSRKAALEAWGADANIFAQGLAEEVTDPELMKLALARPGEVVRVARGTAAEHVKALGEATPKQARRPVAANDAGEAEEKNRPSPRPSPADGRGSRPSPRPSPADGRGSRPSPRPSPGDGRGSRPSRAALEAAERALEAAEARHAKALERIREEERRLEERRRTLIEEQRAERARLTDALEAERERYREALADWGG